MAALIFIMIVIGFLILFAYLKILPAYASKKLVSTFNKMTIAVVFLLSILFYFNAELNLPLSEDLRKLVAVAGAIGVEIGLLIICFILRNFWIFKPPRRPGGR